MRINQLIGERYRIVEPLGEGGMANVYRAHDIILDRDVSLKLMRLDMRDDEDVRRRFNNEIAATSAILHPNIIQVYDYGEEGGSQYLVTEFVAGMDLKRYIAENWPIPVSRIVDIMQDILAGIAVAHQAGIIHRDLKPQNILISNEGEAKISDFGIARAQTSFGMTQTNTAIGSVHYMAPEQVRGEAASNRSDIYSLGIMLYEMITGHVPFDGETAVAIAVKHAQNPMPSVRDVDPRIPQPLENVIFKATAKNPMSRYASAQAMSDDLSTVLSPNRINEPEWHDPNDVDGDNTETKVIPLAQIKEVASQRPTETTKSEPLLKETHADSSAGNLQKLALKSKKKKKRRRYLWIALLVLVFIIGGFGIYGAMQPDNVHVSDVRGMTQANAEKTLQEDGLKLGNITTKHSNDIERGKVIQTNPKVDKTVAADSVIDLVVSKGPAKVRFGDYVNEKYSTVSNKLENKGFEVTKKDVASDTVPKGYIVSQNMDAEDSVVPSKTKVKFKVSTGPKSYNVPNFTGKSQGTVSAWAQTNGVAINFNSVYSDSVPAGYVVSQSMTPGSKLTKNDVLLVTISNGPNEAAHSSSKTSRSSSSSSTSESRESSSSQSSSSSSASDDTESDSTSQPASESTQSSSSSSQSD
ncbi:Stk1 family PASTA domain-containing Ser/Thr kinase [uncultured Weissella sp.]|uniref:Stk1 family PASTA domain-containing Ser/Thr kinase n=1 Tax=uncultured Weissella sp. TaxID=253243 RepID=UPI00258A3660|nr:Stk1 family PASTA domain-containing Ser/Thr kinase [uncultured Weissella sp.]